MFAGLQAKAMAIGAVVLTVLAFFVRLKVVTAQRDKAKAVAGTLKVQAKREKKIKKKKREEDVRLLKELTSIEEEIKKDGDLPGDGSGFGGVEGFNDANKY